MAKKTAQSADAQIVSYRHADKRKNNPEVGIVTPATDPEKGKTRWVYDPHIDPSLQFDPSRAGIEKLIDDALASGDKEAMAAALEELKRMQSPYLNWAGKAERTSFDIDTVSLHVHERIDPASILAVVRKQMKGEGKAKGVSPAIQPGLFDAPFENLPLRDAIDFYRHERGWANRLVSGDSLLVMNSLLQKESMAGKVQMIYIDPPYGIKYGSNFQPFVGKRNVEDRKDEDLTQEPEMIKAFRDTWELGIHSYLTYLRDRLLLARELLNESGSVFMQISDENLHHVREVCDEVFKPKNFVITIVFKKKAYQDATSLAPVNDYIVWYAKDKSKLKSNPLFLQSEFDGEVGKYVRIISPDGRQHKTSDFTQEELIRMVSEEWRLYREDYPVVAQDPARVPQPLNISGVVYEPTPGRHWSQQYPDGMERMARAGRLRGTGNRLYGTVFASDSGGVIPLNNFWEKLKGAANPIYVVQTTNEVISRCLLMTTDPGDLVLDPTCGSGTTAFVAEKWGRRWIYAHLCSR